MAGFTAINSSGMAGPNHEIDQQPQNNMNSDAYSHEVGADFGVLLQHTESAPQSERQPQPNPQLDAHDEFLYSQLQNPDHAHYSAIQAKKQNIKERAESAKRESAAKAAAAEIKRKEDEVQKEQAKAAKEEARAAKEKSKQVGAAHQLGLYKLGKDLMVSDDEFLNSLLSLTNTGVGAKYGVSAADVSNRKKSTIQRESKRKNVTPQEFNRSFDEERVANGTLTAKEAARNSRLRGEDVNSAESQNAAVSETDSEQSDDVDMTDRSSEDLPAEDAGQRTLGGFRPLYRTPQEIYQKMTVGAILNNDAMDLD